MRIVEKDIHKQFQGKDVFGATNRVNDNSPASCDNSISATNIFYLMENKKNNHFLIFCILM